MPYSATRTDWRDAFRSKLFPRINKFKPNMIFISAGFDAHEDDEISDGMGRLIEFDYGWLTKELCKLANTHCEGRIVSVLEGGYNTAGGLMSGLVQSVSFHTAELRSRSKERYKEPTAEELKELTEMDKKMEKERQEHKEILKHSKKPLFQSVQASKVEIGGDSENVEKMKDMEISIDIEAEKDPKVTTGHLKPK